MLEHTRLLAGGHNSISMYCGEYPRRPPWPMGQNRRCCSLTGSAMASLWQISVVNQACDGCLREREVLDCGRLVDMRRRTLL